MSAITTGSHSAVKLSWSSLVKGKVSHQAQRTDGAQHRLSSRNPSVHCRKDETGAERSAKATHGVSMTHLLPSPIPSTSKLPSSSRRRMSPNPSALPTDRQSECNLGGCSSGASWSARIVGAKNMHSSSGCAVRSKTFEGPSELSRSWMSLWAGLDRKRQTRETTRMTSQYRAGLNIVYRCMRCRCRVSLSSKTIGNAGTSQERRKYGRRCR